jgi:hypothetical protein
VAGLVGETFWNALLVSVLWVHAQHRKSGYGTALMGRAEQIAKARACDVVFLNTMTFQAQGFYSKLGYQVFGELTDAPADTVDSGSASGSPDVLMPCRCLEGERVRWARPSTWICARRSLRGRTYWSRRCTSAIQRSRWTAARRP